MIKGIDNFFLSAANLKETKAFYENILGLSTKFNFEERGVIGFKLGNDEPALILKDQHKFPDAKPTIWFVVEDVQKSYEDLLQKGVKFLSPPFQINVGMAVEFEDPAGNRLGLTSYNKS